MAGRTLQITYTGDAARVLAAQQQINRGHQTMQTGTQKAAGFFQQAFGITMPLAAGAAAAAVVVLGKTIITAAADQNEAINVVDKTFGKTAETVKGFAETAAESFGISETAALQAAGGFGAMLKSAGITGDALAEMSTKVVGLAGDLASFKNVAPEEALEKLRSGLAGEAEPLRTFGVFLSEAAVKAEAYKQGIAKVGSELTEAQKVQARYQLILKQTTDAHGDFAATLGDSLPNQMRVLKAQTIDLAASLGQILLPAAQNVVEALNFLLTPLLEAAELMERLGTFTPTPEMLQGTEGWAAAALKLSDAWRAGELSSAAYEEGLRRIGARFEGDQPVLIRQVEHYLALQQSFAEAESGARRLGGAADDASKRLRDAGAGARIFGEELRESLAGELDEVIGTVVKYKEAFSLSPGEMRRITDTWAEIGRTMVRDLREILDSDLAPEMKRGIAALPPEMRHAWVEGNKAQRAAIEASLRQTFNLDATIARLANDARTGGAQVGSSLVEGLRSAIAAQAGEVSRQAAFMVRDAIGAARAEAAAESPSKKMMELGEDMIEGLIKGIERKERDAEEALSRVVDRMMTLRSTIAGGFGGFLNISGGFAEGAPPAGTFIAQQLAGAQQFAAILRALQSRGLSGALLGQIAGAGPEAIPFAQQLLQMRPAELAATDQSYRDIAQIAERASRSLSEAYFGDRVSEMRGDLRGIRDDLHSLAQLLGQLVRLEERDDRPLGDVVDHIRRELIKTGVRNGTAGIP